MLKSRYGEKRAIRKQLYVELRRIIRAERSIDVDNTTESLELHREKRGKKLEHSDIESKLPRWMLQEIYQK